MRKILSASMVIVVVIALLSSCASTKSAMAGPVQDSLSVQLLSEKEVKDAYGWSLDSNPYIALNGILFPKAYDFLVLQALGRHDYGKAGRAP